MPDQQKFDLIVVGGGPGGYVAAIRAAQLGMKTAVVEREHLGGICLNWGCIPTKALLRSSEIFHLMHRLGEFGFSADNVKFLMKKNNITVLDGEAKLTGKNKIAVTGKSAGEYGAKNIIIATGARARS